MKPYQYHVDGFAWLLTLLDSTRVIVTDKHLRDELISSRLAQPAYSEFKVASFKSRYEMKLPGESK